MKVNSAAGINYFTHLINSFTPITLNIKTQQTAVAVATNITKKPNSVLTSGHPKMETAIQITKRRPTMESNTAIASELTANLGLPKMETAIKITKRHPTMEPARQTAKRQPKMESIKQIPKGQPTMDSWLAKKPNSVLTSGHPKMETAIQITKRRPTMESNTAIANELTTNQEPIIHPIYTMTTASCQTQQSRMVTLFSGLDGAALFQRFRSEIFARSWAPTTAATYWNALLSGRKARGAQVTEADKKVLGWLQKKALCHRPHSIPDMTIEDAQRLWEHRESGHARETLAVLLAFEIGQRLSDIAQLHSSDLTVTARNSLCVTFMRGKVIPQIGPYVIFVEPSPLTSELLKLRDECHPSFLFTPPENSTSTREALNTVLRAILNPLKLELRSPRRGGLQRMAQAGVPLPTILSFSRHASLAMLNKYLHHGADVASTEEEQVTAIQQSHSFTSDT